MIKKNWIIVGLISGLLNSCATNVIDVLIQEKNYQGLYLRGVFSWWEADEKYKLQEVSSQRFSTTIELIADGQPYDFKFADADWTPGMNCGYARQSDRTILVGKTYKSDCETNDENFIFTPKETGTFEFVIDFSGFGSPEVTIYRITN
jgi:hypothetical protein